MKINWIFILCLNYSYIYFLLFIIVSGDEMTQSLLHLIENSLTVNCEAKNQLANPVYSTPRQDTSMMASVAEGGEFIKPN